MSVTVFLLPMHVCITVTLQHPEYVGPTYCHLEKNFTPTRINAKHEGAVGQIAGGSSLNNVIFSFFVSFIFFLF